MASRLAVDETEAAATTAGRKRCSLSVGCDLQVAPWFRHFVAPADEGLGLIRLFDPRRYFLG